MVGSDTAGDGTWVMAAAGPAADPAAGTVRSYALRVENGTFLDADAVAAEVEGVLPDPRGWQGLEHVVFQRVADPAQADFTISLASPPTVDRICAPARTYGKWSCREGSDVVLNTDRWLYLTPAYSDTAAYRAYMVNHEVGHYLGHGHATCPAEGVSAPVMLQQSMGLDGCRANPWPTLDGQP
nr:DUF3152 domain-containing protein [Brachybacterium equifaecis]